MPNWSPREGGKWFKRSQPHSFHHASHMTAQRPHVSKVKAARGPNQWAHQWEQPRSNYGTPNTTATLEQLDPRSTVPSIAGSSHPSRSQSVDLSGRNTTHKILAAHRRGTVARMQRLICEGPHNPVSPHHTEHMAYHPHQLQFMCEPHMVKAAGIFPPPVEPRQASPRVGFTRTLTGGYFKGCAKELKPVWLGEAKPNISQIIF